MILNSQTGSGKIRCIFCNFLQNYDMKAFQHKVVWITGASSGIGEALAYEFSRQGARLALSARKKEKLEKVRLKCHELGAEAEIFPFDLSCHEKIPELTTRVIQHYKQVNLLINNGGISQRSLVKHSSLEVDRKIMEINYFGNVALTKALLPHMIHNQEGHIAVTTSIVGKFGFPLRSAYAASKHALHGFYETLGLELADENIRVTLIIPGRIQTNISLHALDGTGQEHGLMDKGQNSGLTPEQSALKIIRGLQKGKREIMVGGNELLMVYIRKFFPTLFYRLARKISHV